MQDDGVVLWFTQHSTCCCCWSCGPWTVTKISWFYVAISAAFRCRSNSTYLQMVLCLSAASAIELTVVVRFVWAAWSQNYRNLGESTSRATKITLDPICFSYRILVMSDAFSTANGTGFPFLHVDFGNCHGNDGSLFVVYGNASRRYTELTAVLPTCLQYVIGCQIKITWSLLFRTNEVSPRPGCSKTLLGMQQTADIIASVVSALALGVQLISYDCCMSLCVQAFAWHVIT